MLSEDNKVLPMAKYIELITRFVPFDMNQKNLITKMTTRMQNIAIDDERVIIRTKLEKPSKIKGLALI